MTKFLSLIIISLTGSAIILGGAKMDLERLMDGTEATVNEANLHQIRTTIELYYADQGKYPTAKEGKELIDILEESGYLLSRPINCDGFGYQSDKNGQSYQLILKN